MKKIKSLLLAIIMMFTCLAFVACKQEDNAPKDQTTVTLNLETADIIVGGRLTLKATIEYADEDVTWSSSDETVATVDEGIVYGIGEGTAEITAKVGGAQAICIVNVVGGESGNGMQAIPVLHFELSAERVWVGYTFEISASLKLNGEPVTAEIIFSSSNADVAKIENGQIVALSVGETQIMASCSYQGGLYQKTQTLTVVENPVN